MNMLNRIFRQIIAVNRTRVIHISIWMTLFLLTSCGQGTDTSALSLSNAYEAAAVSENDTLVEEATTSLETESGSTPEASVTFPEGSAGGIAELQIHFIDVGQGDSTFIICGSEAMLIDAGDNNHGTEIQNYIQKQGIETLKYVICTHPDSDHIGGMDVILYKFDCVTIFMTDEEKDTDTYRDVIDAMKSKDDKNTLPVVGEQYSLGDAEFTILAPARTDADSNNNSIAIILTHGDNKFLFTGDAEEAEERDLMECGISIDADVYKAGHHGSRSSSSVEFLEAVSPVYAVISCAEGNSYGHPHAETLNHLRAMGVQVFRTDEQGSIIAFSDGSNITWNCPPSDTWKAGESTQKSDPVTYICNTNTKKFHYPDCSSVEQMSEKNKLPVTLSREELINQGYEPCKRCNP